MVPRVDHSDTLPQPAMSSGTWFLRTSACVSPRHHGMSSQHSGGRAGKSIAEVKRLAGATLIPLDVAGDRQYLMSVRHGHLLQKQVGLTRVIGRCTAVAAAAACTTPALTLNAVHLLDRACCRFCRTSSMACTHPRQTKPRVRQTLSNQATAVPLAPAASTARVTATRTARAAESKVFNPSVAEVLTALHQDQGNNLQKVVLAIKRCLPQVQLVQA
jgi:hypothetical protein